MQHSIQINHKLGVNKYFLAALTMLFLPISALSIDIFVPSLPAMSHYFAVDKSFAQLSITVYMMALGIMQLFAGPISDSYGRRKPFLMATLIYIIVTLLIPGVSNISQLLVLRVVQGIAVAICVVPMRSVIADLFEGDEYYKMMNYMVMTWSVGPIIAPAIGGYLQYYFGWQASFYFLGIYSLIASILLAIYLPETSVHSHPFNLMSIMSRYKTILLNKNYLIALMINSTIYSLMVVFAVVGTFLLQIRLNYSPLEFGHIYLFTGLMWFLGALTNRFFIRISMNKKIGINLSSMFLISVIALGVNIIIPINIYMIMIPLCFMLWFAGIVYPNLFASSVALFPNITGSANALFSGFVYLISGMSTGFATNLKSSSQIPLSLTYVALTGFCLLLFFVSNYNSKFGS